MIEYNWIIPHEDVESIEWTFLDGFDAFKNELFSKSECLTSLQSPVFHGGTLEDKKNSSIQDI